MKKARCFGLFVFFLAAIWVFAVCCDVQAQGEKGKGGKKSKDKKKNEQVTAGEEAEAKKNSEGKKGKPKQYKGKKDKKQKGKEIKKGDPGTDEGKNNKKNKYKPRGINDEDFKKWKNGNPPGWSKGLKKGWRGAGAPPGKMGKQGGQTEEMVRMYPRGSEDWGAKKKKEWEGKLEKSMTKIRNKVKSKKGMSEEDKESAVISIEGAAREGVPVENVEATVDRAIDRGMTGAEIEKVTRAMSYGADKETDYDELGGFINKKMDEGKEGDEIALSIYEEIDERHMEKQQLKQEEPKKKSWWWKNI